MDTHPPWSMFSNLWRHPSYIFILLYFLLIQQTDAQMNNCNNCGNNCGGCGVQFPDPPPIILQPPAPPPNNTCCCDSCNNNNVGGNPGAFNGNNVGCGSNCGNNCGGGNCGCDFCGGGVGNECCCCGNGNNVCNSGPLTNQNPNAPGGPQSRTNRCCQVICTKCCNCCGGNAGTGNTGAGNGGCCCQQSCQPCCQCCQPCCCGNGGGGGCCQCQCCGQLCNSFCTPCCCNPCSCYDCCHDCYPNDFDCEIGYKRRRRRQIFAPHPAAAYHRFRSFPRRFYVLPLPLPPAQDDLPPRARGAGRRPHTHHHFHHHFFHCCPCACNCACNNAPGFNTQNCNYGSSQNAGGNANFADPGQSQWPPTFGQQQEGCFGSGCAQPPADPQPCALGNNFPAPQQQDFYGNYGSNFGNNNFGSTNNNFGHFGNGYNDCPGCGTPFGGGFRRFQRLLLRRKRQLVNPAFNGDKVLNFLIPMFYKKPQPDMAAKDSMAAIKCPNKRTSRSFPCPLPIQPIQNDFRPLTHQNTPCNNQFLQMGRDPGSDQTNRQCCCQCCACPANKKRRRRKRRK